MALALRKPNVAIIAEVKRRSPSKGLINAFVAADSQSRAYEFGGAAAISVLTEPRHFGGSIEDLRRAAAISAIPVLCKDFIVDDLQITEARAAGAAAVLLITRALSEPHLAALMYSAREWEMEALVEVRSEQELGRALAAGARLIGVNNRDLESLEIDPRTSEQLLPLIPPDRIAVAESGITTLDDVRRSADAGADAVLVGSSLSGSEDPASAVRALTGVTRIARGG